MINYAVIAMLQHACRMADNPNLDIVEDWCYGKQRYP